MPVVPVVLRAGPSEDQLREALEAFRGGLEVHRPLEALVASRAVPVVLRAGPSAGLQLVLRALEA